MPLKPRVYRMVDGRQHLIMTAKEWEAAHSDYKGVVSADSPLHEELEWAVGTKTHLDYNPMYGTCLLPVIVEG